MLASETSMKTAFFAALACLCLSTAALAQEHEHMTPPKTSPQFEQLKKLVGKWEGTMEGDMKATAEFRMTGGGSALMQILGAGTPYEMVTMFTMDGDHLTATHYCAAHNQPRMQAVSGSEANAVEFKFVDGANIQADKMHMDNVKMVLTDADHHTEIWTSIQNGKSFPGQFVFHRVP
jgi:hypothetical protein